jgi:DNA-binding LacI/PurR family transcriptional regulator
MSATIRDIAQRAGVSIGSVSRALKNQPGMSESTRAAICRAATELGYDLGRLRPHKLRRLVFLLHRQHNTLAFSPFYSKVLHGVEEVCREHGIAPSFLALGPADPVRELIRQHDPDALMLAGFFEPELIMLLAATGKPMALVDLWVPGFASANPDNAAGAYLATRHLLEQGRTRIAFLAGPLAHYSIQQRARGYRQALFDAGLLADPALEASLPPGLDLEVATELAVRQLLELPTPPDALFAYNDSAALVAMRTCQAAGLKVPDDIAIVGFDDIEAASYATPPLTTVRVDKEALGRLGVELLLSEPGQTPIQSAPVELVVRASSADHRQP